MNSGSHGTAYVWAEPCRLCGASSAVPVNGPGCRHFLHCHACDLVFVETRDLVSRSEEIARYRLHDNTSDNAGYVAFLSGVADAVCALPLPGRRVLDFGSGPAAILTELLRRREYECVSYDPLFGKGNGALDGCYDAVVLCEVIEHLREPCSELTRIRTVLASGGFVVVHTLLRPSEPTAFAHWWYARDCTHINFWSARSLEYAARTLGTQVWKSNGRDLVVIGPVG